MEVFVSQTGLIISYILLAIALVAAVGLPLYKSLEEPKKIIQALIGFGVLAVVFLISWAIAGSEVNELYLENDVDETMSKLIGGFLTMMYLLGGIAVVGIVYTEISKAIK